MRLLPLRKIAVLLPLLLLFAAGCKKENKTVENASTGNYIQISNDKRPLGAIPGSDITVGNAAWSNPDQWQLSLGIKTLCKGIAGLANGSLEIYINIWDKRLSKTEYSIVPGYSAGGSTAGPAGTASIGVRPYKANGSGGLTFFDVQRGKLLITKDSDGVLKSAILKDVLLLNNDSQSYKLSAVINLN